MIDKPPQKHRALASEGKGIRLRLYVASSTPNSQRARTNLLAALQVLTAAPDHHLEIIDVLADGRRALVDNVVVTPTLVALVPKRRMVMIGDLSDMAKLTGFLESAANAG